MRRATLKLKRLAAYVPGAYWIKERWNTTRVSRAPVTRPIRRGPPPRADEGRLRAAYHRSEASSVPDDFVLYRIIGNDLIPRHRKGQSRENLAFILNHEPDLPGCEKRFIVNRLVDPSEDRAVVDLLENRGMAFIRLPFNRQAYRATEWDIAGVPPAYAPYTRAYHQLQPEEQGHVRMRLYRLKNNAVMNNNGARNAALADGRGRAKWILPFDGNCFFTEAAWKDLRESVARRPHFPYHIVPMTRVTDNRDLIAESFEAKLTEEPQIAFRWDAPSAFDPDYFYGRRPKVELLWRLGVPGPWDMWPIEPWDLGPPGYAEDAGAFVESGWVARLFSGQRELELEGKLAERGLARDEAVEDLLDRLDHEATMQRKRPSSAFCTVAPSKMGISLVLRDELRAAAEEALHRGPFSVIDKTTLPPSGKLHDYWHPAPYYWPHPLRRLGFADVCRDGVRVPGTRLYEPESEQFDRTRLQRMFDDSFVLALAFRETSDARYAKHAARLVRTWFLDPATAMSPHLIYAQVRRGHNRNQGSNSGIIEAKDFYYFLDAVRILSNAGALGVAEVAQLNGWLTRYLDWVLTSPQGVSERAMPNNHGVYYDLQVAAIAFFLGNDRLVRLTLRDSRSRILQHFEPDGRQPEELRRPTTAHYCAFNLQGWVNLATLADAAGEDLWGFEGPDGQSIPCGVRWLLSYMGRPWSFPQADRFDEERFLPIYCAYLDRFGEPPNVAPTPSPEAIKPIFHPHDGIRPFWQFR